MSSSRKLSPMLPSFPLNAWRLIRNRGTANSLQQIIVGRVTSGLGAAGVTTMVAIVITGMSLAIVV